MTPLQSTKYPCNSAWPHKSVLATALGSDKKISLKNDVLEMFWLDTRFAAKRKNRSEKISHFSRKFSYFSAFPSLAKNVSRNFASISMSRKNTEF